MLVLAMEFSKIEAQPAQMHCGRDRQEAGRMGRHYLFVQQEAMLLVNGTEVFRSECNRESEDESCQDNQLENRSNS